MILHCLEVAGTIFLAVGIMLLVNDSARRNFGGGL